MILPKLALRLVRRAPKGMIWANHGHQTASGYGDGAPLLWNYGRHSHLSNREIPPQENRRRSIIPRLPARPQRFRANSSIQL